MSKGYLRTSLARPRICNAHPLTIVYYRRRLQLGMRIICSKRFARLSEELTPIMGRRGVAKSRFTPDGLNAGDFERKIEA